MARARIACVRYLNTAPLIEGLQRLADVELICTVPSRIGEMVATGRADVGLASLIDAVGPQPLALLPVGMIGCDGPTLTVRLFSDVPFDRIERLHADTDSRTSVALARILLRRLHGARPEIVPFDAREGLAGDPPEANGLWPPSVLLIGDKVVSSSPPLGRYPHQMDLGQAWHGLTGLPFVYAVWAARPDRVDDPAVGLALAALDRARRRNAMRLGWIAAAKAPDHGWPVAVARRYLTELLRYDVTPDAMAGAERFIHEARDLDLLPADAAPLWHTPMCPV